MSRRGWTTTAGVLTTMTMLGVLTAAPAAAYERITVYHGSDLGILEGAYQTVSACDNEYDGHYVGVVVHLAGEPSTTTHTYKEIR